MLQNMSSLHVALARTDDDLRAAQRLRYDVFVRELGSGGAGVDHVRKVEADRFDAYADHLILRDSLHGTDGTDGVIGVCRLMTSDHARAAGQFYSESEFDLTVLTQSPRRLLELGRSCLHPDYRGGSTLMALWQGVARYVKARDLDTLFGVASFHGTDPGRLRNAVSHLHHVHLAPPEMRVTSRTPDALALLPKEQTDRKSAMRDTPALIKSYLKLGGAIGQGVYVDHAFNTIDICMILDTALLRPDALRSSTRRRA